MFSLLLLPFRLTTGAAKAGYRTGRLLGYRRIFVFGTGVVAGLLVAPMPGRALRARLSRMVDQVRPSDDGTLAERVRFELSHSPRTWHLPQPAVEVIAGTAVLRGEVPHAEGRAELGRAAAAVSGVVGVDNLVSVASLAEANGSV